LKLHQRNNINDPNKPLVDKDGNSEERTDKDGNCEERPNKDEYSLHRF
jgi:hypothetical protein